MMEALSSSEKSVLTRATRRNIPEDAILRIWKIFGKMDTNMMMAMYDPKHAVTDKTVIIRVTGITVFVNHRKFKMTMSWKYIYICIHKNI
jgi:hypothetical protein